MHRYAMFHPTLNPDRMKKLFLLSLLLFFSFTSQAQRWSYKTLNENKLSMPVATIGNKVFFYSGTKYVGSSSMLVSEVEIFDLAKDTREIVTLTGAAVRTNCATTTLNSKVYFAGGVGYPETGGVSKRIDIYDTLTGSWSTAELGMSRQNLAGASAGGKVLFGGGYNFGLRKAVDYVDIYNSVTDGWTSAFFNGHQFTSNSVSRDNLTAASLGGKVFFAGGNFSLASNKVNIYDAVQNKWLPEAKLSQQKHQLSSVTYKNKAYFIGGTVKINGPLYTLQYPSDTIDVYNNETNSWSVLQMPRLTLTSQGTKRAITQSVVVGCKIFMVPTMSGWRGTTYAPEPGTEDTITVYDLARDTWSYITLPHKRTGVTLAAAGNKVLFAGGRSFIFPGDEQNHIDMLTVDPNLRLTVDHNSVTGYDFGDVTLEDSKNATVHLSNEGDFDLTFASFGGKISVTGDVENFMLLENELQLTDTLSPAEIITLPVTFKPTTPGLKEIVLTIRSNDPDQSEYLFTIQGNGASTTGLSEAVASGTIQCYPNPATEKINIRSGFQLPHRLQIINLLGHLVAEEEMNTSNQELNISHFPQGLYFLKVSEGTKNAVIPLVKK